MTAPVEHTWRLAPRWVIAARFAAAFLIIVMIVTPLLLALHTVDVRNARRRDNQTKIEALAAVAEANARVSVALAKANRHVCQVQNTDAHRLNMVIDYFELISKQANPGPATDHFWAGVPRPVVRRCSPTP